VTPGQDAHAQRQDCRSTADLTTSSTEVDQVRARHLFTARAIKAGRPTICQGGGISSRRARRCSRKLSVERD
jgi:hypothetical protein